MTVKQCKECEKKFVAIGNRRYCSQECFKLSRRESMKKFFRAYRILHKQDRSYRKDIDKKIRRNHFLKNKERFYNRRTKWGQDNPDKVIAQRLAQKVTMKENQNCERCKVNLARERHHPDYSEPLRIIFLCISCHRIVNKNKMEVLV